MIRFHKRNISRGKKALIILGISGFLFFFIFLFFWQKLATLRNIQQAEEFSRNIIKSARDKEHLLNEKVHFDVQEYEMNLRDKLEINTKELQQKNRNKQSSVDREIHKNKTHIQDLRNHIDHLFSKIQSIKNRSRENLKIHHDLLKKQDQLREQYLEKLEKQLSLDTSLIKQKIQDQLVEEAQNQGQWQAQKILENSQKDLDKNVSRILTEVLCRFKKPSCDERGLRPVSFKNSHTFKSMVGQNLEKVEVECGVDILINEEELTFNVQGLDPVRREWGRMSLEKLSKKRRIYSHLIPSVISQSKKELFRKIKRDGQRICHDLRLHNIPLEIKNMMGALRYRYSFEQNQHFHCEEVGWLCGLFMAELDQGVELGRRAGLFHDIGKAMDHYKQGGHAMIGADFIEKYGQNEKVVRAVRAHHHDVTPKDSLDFLVIAADAISGSRPGARRFTVESYNQKISTLEKIGKSFKGVQDIYIMNAGREMRVIVNSKKMDDKQALDLSKKLARKIEQECSYPGWIKVNVVRQLEVHQTTRVAR